MEKKEITEFATLERECCIILSEKFILYLSPKEICR